MSEPLICADTNSWIAWARNESGADVSAIDVHLQSGTIRMLPPVLAELLSDPQLPPELEDQFLLLDVLPLHWDTWVRAGKLRAKLITQGFRPKLIDTVIAQLCIDHNLPLLTRDRDFSLFVKHAGLRLA